MDCDGYDFADNYYSDDTEDNLEIVAMSLSGPDHGSTSQAPEKNYTVLTEAEIRERQHEDISQVSSVLYLPPQDASRLLCFFKWKISNIYDEWFADEKSVRDKVGLLVTSCEGKTSIVLVGDDKKKVQCGICFDDYGLQGLRSLACGHPYCKTCWKTYIRMAIDDGPGSLFLACPGCKTGVTRDMIDGLATKEYREKYDSYFVRSYVECKEMIKWCPAPNCVYAIEFERGGDGNGFDVTCLCSHVFCWNCVEEPHRPVDCELVGMWMVKKTTESENNKWILAYSKPCPKCKRPIEKNNGCNHMRCSAPCNFHFCWICLEDWKGHAEYYNCNIYKGPSEDDKARINAKASLERYKHYYERWAGNHKSREKAIKDLHKHKNDYINILSTVVEKPIMELEFVLGAWKQIVEGRRVLKWSYVYGYYLSEKEPHKQQFFEYLQGQAEQVLEKLHGCAENELSCFLKHDTKFANDKSSAANNEDAFWVYRGKLVDLTKVTCKHFEELVQALENGLTEVANGPNKKVNKRKGSTSSAEPSVLMDVRDSIVVNFLRRANRGEDIAAENFSSLWICDRCGCANPISAGSCQACLGRN